MHVINFNKLKHKSQGKIPKSPCVAFEPVRIKYDAHANFPILLRYRKRLRSI
ncbi:hypothetical protein LEP1GSC178_3359 [Leptospira licerasiae str. MMD4847]|uniref:Uncharacterized protein n=1 Tax=Leptospira licerasiae str. MMD4847 TaxID=1049971 RepID=A0ABP2RGT9_9LEPT|nr:hypothetical protein LEP1GSC178_3359 [Leptospira licerasiae str. MMD4847]